MNKICKNCGIQFIVAEFDQSFYNRIDVPTPTLCPDCRQQRRIANRNERKFYKRKCDLTGNEIVTIYSPDKEVVVYGLEDWWSDKWDGLKFGRDFDFNKPFFEQFENLSKVVPRPPMVNMFNENSLYTNHSAYLKNCYMCMNTGWGEDCMYLGNYNLYNKNCMDCVAIQNGELCYFCTNTKVATNSNYLYECINCHDSSFLYDCHSCSNCFMCFNLRHKQFHILNKGYCENEYKQKLKELMPKTAEEYEKTFQEYKEMMARKAIHKYIVTENCENSNGDNLFNNKNTKDSYYAFGNEDIAYCYDCGRVKDSLDATEPFGGEIQYETHGCNNGYNLIGCSKCYECHDLFYSQYCWNSDHLFGCFGLKKNKYCILNKQYTKEEYEMLVPKIIEHMGGRPASARREHETEERTGLVGSQPNEVEPKNKEWGEFFPISMSAFCYNETIAQDYYPITKEEAIRKGWKWKDADSKEYQPQTYEVPEIIEEVPDSIVNELLACSHCKKNFRITKSELSFYRRKALPIPKKCPDCRHFERMNLRNPRQLWDRNCAKCGIEIQTTYSPDRPEIVYCGDCYLKDIY